MTSKNKTKKMKKKKQKIDKDNNLFEYITKIEKTRRISVKIPKWLSKLSK